MVMVFSAGGRLQVNILQLIVVYFCHWSNISHHPLHFLLPQAYSSLRLPSLIHGYCLFSWGVRSVSSLVDCYFYLSLKLHITPPHFASASQLVITPVWTFRVGGDVRWVTWTMVVYFRYWIYPSLITPSTFCFHWPPDSRGRHSGYCNHSCMPVSGCVF